jgi:hypothetical protein
VARGGGGHHPQDEAFRVDDRPGQQERLERAGAQQQNGIDALDELLQPRPEERNSPVVGDPGPGAIPQAGDQDLVAGGGRQSGDLGGGQTIERAGFDDLDGV